MERPSRSSFHTINEKSFIICMCSVLRKNKGGIMRFIIFCLVLPILLGGCDRDKVIKMDDKTVYTIKCEGLDSVDGQNVVVTVRDDNIIIQYGNSLIVAKNCLIEQYAHAI